MNKILVFLSIFLVFSIEFSAAAQNSTSPDDAKLYFIAPHDGAVIRGPVKVRFGLSGMGIAPAGIEQAGTGHHHLIIDAPLPPFDENIPLDENYRHFGGGQTETEIELTPGKHTLQLLLGDQNHVPHNPPVYSKLITITIMPSKAK